MATGEAEITSVVTSEPWNPGTDHQPDNIQSGLSNTEPDEVGTKRAKLLRRMCIITLVMLLISVGSIIVGVMAFLTSDSQFPYVMSGGAISGGMAFLYVLCASYVYFEGKKTKTGTKMTSVFTGCAHAPLDTIYYINVQDISLEKLAQLNLFLSKLTGTQVGFSTCGLLIITKEFILTMAGVFLTYFAVLYTL